MVGAAVRDAAQELRDFLQSDGIDLALADVAVPGHPEPLPVREFGPRMGPWYAELGRGDGASVLDDTPWVARGHSRETTFQRDLTEPAQVDDAVRELTGRVLEDVVAEGRPVVGLILKVRYAPFVTKTHARKIPETFDREEILARALDLAAGIEAGRPIRLLGLRAEMAMPDAARKGHTPTRGGW